MKLVVCFPGIGYHCDKPLLYYGRRVAESVGYKEYKNVEYVNRIGNVKGDPVKMQAAFEDHITAAGYGYVPRLPAWMR